MSALEVNELHRIWLKFLNTTKTDDGEMWLDTFLAKYLNLLCNANGNPNSSFSFHWKSSGNILAHQLLSDMYEICEKVKAAPLNDDTSVVSKPFQDYLLKGRGWKILWALENIGIQNLLCLKDLIKLLILHVPVLLTLPVSSSTIPVPLQHKPKCPPLDSSFFQSKYKSIPQNIDLRISEKKVPPNKRNFIGKKRFRRKKLKPIEDDGTTSSDEDQILLEPCAIPASQLKSLHFMSRINSTSVQKSISEIDESDHELSLTDSSSFIEEYRCYNISVIDYMHFILNLFQESIQLDHRNSEYNSSSVPLILEFSLNAIGDFHCRQYAFEGWSEEDIHSVQDQLLKLVFLSAVVTHSVSDYTGAPNGNKVISTLIAISEDMLLHSSDENALTFAKNVIKGCLILISNTIKVYSGEHSRITCIIKTFSESGANLYQNVVLSLQIKENELYTNECYEIISLVSGIIISLKYLKLAVIQEEAKGCVKQSLHHHHDILGSYADCLEVNNEFSCVIASMAYFLLKSFNLHLLKSTFCEIIKQLKLCGICCCINPCLVLSSLLSRFTSYELDLQSSILMLLEKHLLPQLGLTTKYSAQCFFCSKRLNESKMITLPSLNDPAQPSTNDQPNILTHNPAFNSLFCNSFIVYNDLLNHPDSEMLEHVSKHLLQIFSELAYECKSQMFFKVVLPNFLILSVDISMPLTQRIKSKCFLSVLHVTLNDESFASVFIQSGGVPVLQQFLLLEEFRLLALNVLRILMFSENKSNDEFDFDNFHPAEIQVPASTAFFNFILENTRSFTEGIKFFLPKRKVDENGDVIYPNLTESLHCLCDVWKCYREILTAVKNSNFLKMSDNAFEAGYSLFTVLLKNLNTIVMFQEFEDKPEITQKILLLLQSLLAICLKVQKERPSQLAILEAVKNNLKNYCPKLIEHRILLFDLILKCSLSSIPTVILPLHCYKKSSSSETVDGTTSSDRDVTDSASYNESYTADTEGSSSCSFQKSCSLQYEVTHQNYIECGELIKMLLELVLHLQKEHTNDWKPSALYILQHVVKLCQECDMNKKVLCKQGISTLLLNTFSYSLKILERDIYEYQKTVLDLFVILAEISMEPDDLKTILNFTKSPHAPLALILKCLNTLVDDMAVQPVWSASFPCLQKVNNSMKVKKRLKSTYDILQSVSSYSDKAFGWNNCALCFPIMEDTKWNSIHKGFSIAMWVNCNKIGHLCPLLIAKSNCTPNRLLEQTKEDNNGLFGNDCHLFHLASIGSEKFLLELWYQSSENDLILRITSSNKNEVTCLAKGVCKSLFSKNTWHYLVLNYSENEHKSLVTSRAHILLDGIKENILNFTYKKLGSSVLNYCHVLLGHSEQHLESIDLVSPAYSIGSFKLFNGEVITKDIAFYLACLGPNFLDLTECAVQKQTLFVPKIKVFQNYTSISQDVFMGIKPLSLYSLQNSLLCSYTAENIESYLVYPSMTRGFFSLGIKSKLSPTLENLYRKQPLALEALPLGHVTSSEFHGFLYAFQHIGGMTNFLFLFAFIIENGGKEQDVADSLNLILKLLNKNTLFAEDFIRIKGYQLLTQMISSNKCTVSEDLFKVMQQNCLTHYIQRDKGKNSILQSYNKPLVVSNAAVFSLMLNSISTSRNKSLSIPSALFSLLESLLSSILVSKHNLQINLKQMKHVNVLSTLFWLLKKQNVMSESLFPVSVAKMIPPLMKQLLIYGFEESIFKSICHFTLLLHDSSSAYVRQTRSALFFLATLDELVCRKTDMRNIATSSSVRCSGNPDKSFSPHTSSSESFLFKRSSSYSEQYTVSTSTENLRASAKLKPTASLNAIDFSVDIKADRDDASSTEEKFHIEKNKLQGATNDEETSQICRGLLELILHFITSKEPASIQNIFQLIEPEQFIVLANTVQSDVCVLAIKIISRYLKEANEGLQNSFLNMKGFHLLANQLFGHTYEEELFNACFSIILDTPLLSVNVSHAFNTKTATTFQIMSWLPILSILPKTVASPEFCEKIILCLTKFLQVGPSVISDLIDNGLYMSISLLLVEISLSLKGSSTNIRMFNSNIYSKAAITLLKVISTELCSSKRSKDFFALFEVFHLLSSIERTCIEQYGSESASVQFLRECQCRMYLVVIDLSKTCDFRILKTNSLLLNDKAVWELLSEFQESLGTFSTTSAPESDFNIGNEALTTQNVEERVILEIPMAEVVKRFEVLIEEAAFFIIFKDSRVKISVEERDFIKAFFNFSIKGLAVSMNKNVNISKSEYSALMCCLKESLKKELSSLLITLLSPNQDTKVKEYIVDILATHPYNRKILTLVVYSIGRVENFLLFLNDLVLHASPDIKKKAFVLSNLVHEILKDSSSLNALKSNNTEKLKTEWMQLWEKDRQKWILEANKWNAKVFVKYENLAQLISIEALKVTKRVFEIQNNERKMFMEDLKIKYYEEASERMSWIKLIEQMTHERAIWCIPDSYPQSWELDPTEGPLRIRRRLKRCFLKVESRFLREEYTDKLVNTTKERPFVSLLMPQNEFSDSAAVLHRLHSHEQIEYTSTCKIVTAFEETRAEILIGACCIHLIREDSYSQIKMFPTSESWPFYTIKEILPRRYELQNNAFELFLNNGLTYLIAFNSEREFQYIWRQLESHGLPCQTTTDVLTITQLWREGSMTNFEYLTLLNKLSGRSFNDLMQYPVFPYILADYVNSYINLSHPAIYRILEKPVAIQHSYREKFYKDTYELLKEQACGPFNEPQLPISGPYHYGSHYSNSGSVLHFLIRLLPYTYSFIKYQDDNFDIPDRSFHSVHTSWQLVTKDSTSDVKELIPEFFFLPEFMVNSNGFDFGVRQSGIRVNDVLLPPWCKQNPRLFILIHRQALESETVTTNIHNWIDLVFGHKQTGEPAINAVNVYHPATYFGLDINQWKDPITKQALRVMIKTLGQMPKQLFSTPHPMVSLSLSGLDLTDDSDDSMEAVETVKGIKWGDYAGSPSTGTPSLVWCRRQNVVLGSFLPLLANYMFGLGENICVLLNQKKNIGSDVSSATYIMSAALISWGHKDGIIRIKLCRDQPAIPLLGANTIDPVCLCASAPDCNELFVAHKSGLIDVFSLNLGPHGQTVTLENPPLQLNAHSETVTSIYICKAFSIFVTTSKDCSVVIWDLNSLSYVRSITDHDNVVQLVTVSDTLGDIASSSYSNGESCLKVHTINGEKVGTVKIPDIISAMCYSTAPEGVSVNTIATGLHSGKICLWSSWDLKPMREITCDRFHLPIKCIVFSADNQHLFASNANGTVAVWEKPSKGLTSVPRLLVFT